MAASPVRPCNARPFGWAMKRRSAARAGTLWTVIVALVIYGYAGVLLQMLGPMHRHAEAAPAAASVLAERVDGLIVAATQWHNRLMAQTVFVHERERFLPFARPDAHDETLPHVHALDRAHDPAHDPAHNHGLFERHHHDAGDASVVSLDGPAGSAAAEAPSASLGSATLPMCTPPVLALPRADAGPRDWRAPVAPRWRNAELKLLERPPQA